MTHSPNTTIASTRKAVAFITMGCAKNEVDSAAMMKRLVEAGYAITDDPEDADVVIVNTCSFIQEATEESIDAVLDACDLDRVKAGKAGLIVAGCMPSRYKDDLTKALPEVRCFVPCNEEEHIVYRVQHLLHGLCLSSNIVNANEMTTDVVKQQIEPFAYVKISDGCDRFCSYCTIPFIRGRYHSFSYERIFADVSEAMHAGAREIVLVAQDTGRWGEDLPGYKTLADLLESLAMDFPALWFRIMYIQPEGISDELIEVVARHENICSYFDIPFQHASASIIESMNRTGDAVKYRALIDRIRKAIPDVTLRTTLMVGFPGESEEDFDVLTSFVEEAELDYIGLFAFSCEEGTRAEKLPDHIPDDVKLRRLQELRDLADTVSSSVINRRVGQETQVLVCGQEEDGQWFGRTQAQAPEVDGLTYIEGKALGSSSCEFLDVGTFLPLRIEDTLLYEMEGTVLDERA